VSDVGSPSPHPADARHLLVIGAGPGIGAATARRFIRDGYRVTLAARHRDRLEELAADVRSTGAEVAVVAAGASESAHLHTGFQGIQAALGGSALLPRPPKLFATSATIAFNASISKASITRSMPI